jgi:hypothetical protein
MLVERTYQVSSSPQQLPAPLLQVPEIATYEVRDPREHL